MDDGHSVHTPLLENGGVEIVQSKKKTTIFVSSVKWVLKFLMWTLFVAWIAAMFLLPAEFGGEVFNKWNHATKGTVFGITGR